MPKPKCECEYIQRFHRTYDRFGSLTIYFPAMNQQKAEIYYQLSGSQQMKPTNNNTSDTEATRYHLSLGSNHSGRSINNSTSLLSQWSVLCMFPIIEAVSKESDGMHTLKVESVVDFSFFIYFFNRVIWWLHNISSNHRLLLLSL